MISLITRQSIFQTHTNITSEIIEMQKAFYDEDDYFESEEEKQHYLELFDAKDISYQKVEKTYSVLATAHTDIDTHTKQLSQKLVDLLQQIKVFKLIIIAHCNVSFVGNQDNKYLPLQAAIKKLQTITHDAGYKGALSIDVDDLPLLLDIVFWISRCDASAPEYIFFSDEQDRLAFNICRYGNVHVIEFGNKILTNNTLISNGFSVIEGSCSDKFSDESKITGREIKI